MSNSTSVNQESFAFKFALSSAAAVVAETVTYPLDLTKTRLQIQGEASRHASSKSSKPTPGHQHRGMVATGLGIAREEGIHKLWQGVTPALYRHIVYTGCRMSFYEMFREKVFKKNTDGSFALWKAMLSGFLAGAMSQFIASPTDLVKVRMQMEGRRLLEGKKPRVKTTSHAFKTILREGGVRGLWSGWVPNVQRAALVNLGDLATYDTAKHLILSKTDLKDNHVTHTLASMCSGVVAALMGTPADVVKTRIMNQPTKNGKGTLYSGSVDCLVKTVRQEGFLALYKGLIPIWIRMAPWSVTFWLTYEEVRKISGTSSF